MRVIIQGEKETFNIGLRVKKNGVTTPYDLTGYTEIKVCFKVGSTVLEKKQTLAEVSVVGVDTAGDITTDMLAVDSAAFAAGNGVGEVTVTKAGGVVDKFPLPSLFKIEASICP